MRARFIVGVMLCVASVGHCEGGEEVLFLRPFPPATVVFEWDNAAATHVGVGVCRRGRLRTPGEVRRLWLCLDLRTLAFPASEHLKMYSLRVYENPWLVVDGKLMARRPEAGTPGSR